jgi:hypothetical protein
METHSRWRAAREAQAARCAHVPVETAWTASMAERAALPSAQASTAQPLKAAPDSAALPRKGPRASTGAGPSRESDCEPQFTVELGQGEMSLRVGRRLCRTRSQGARESNSQPGEVTTRMRLGCSCLVWGRLFLSFVAWRILTFKFERPSHFAESAAAPSRRRVEISSVARFNRIRVG